MTTNETTERIEERRRRDELRRLTAPQQRLMDDVDKGTVRWHPRRGAGILDGTVEHPGTFAALEKRGLIEYEWGHVDPQGREYAVIRRAGSRPDVVELPRIGTTVRVPLNHVEQDARVTAHPRDRQGRSTGKVTLVAVRDGRTHTFNWAEWQREREWRRSR